MDLGLAPAQGTIALIIVTALIASMMTVWGQKFAGSILNLILRPFIFLKEKIYKWIAPRNPLSISDKNF